MSAPTYIDPGLLDFASPAQRRYCEAIELHGSARAAARALGVAPNAVSGAIERLRRHAADRGYSPDHDMTHTVPDGFKVRGVSTYYDRDGQARGQWVKSAADDERRAEMLRAAIAAMAEDIPRVDPIEAPAWSMASLANLYTITDYHLGMYAWAKESGSAWDIQIAENTMLSAFTHMVTSAPKARLGIINIQGDFLHTDGPTPVTPMHGHVLDAAGRYSEMVAAAVRVLRRVIDLALMRHEAVELLICEGNHDLSGSMWLRHMFSALYENEPRLTVNDSELPFYVIQHGQTMLAFHHGHQVKNEALPLLFAAQFPAIWGSTSKRYGHCGHRHHTDEKEHAGMKVIQHPTLAARDAYAARGGWIAERSAIAITYHDRFGAVGRVEVTPEMLETAQA